MTGIDTIPSFLNFFSVALPSHTRRLMPRYPPKMFGALPFGESCSAGRNSQDARSAQRAALRTQDVCSPTATAQATALSYGDVHKPHMDVRELALTSHVGMPHEDGVRRATTQVGHTTGAAHRGATQVPWSREQRRHYQVHRKAIDDDQQCEQGQNKCLRREDACAQVPVRVSKP